MAPLPTYHFHVARAARARYSFTQDLFSSSGNIVSLDLHAARLLAQRMNEVRRTPASPTTRPCAPGTSTPWD